MGIRVAIVTLGCKVNQCDSGGLSLALMRAGLELAGAEEKVDLFIVNTCSVTQKANAESRQLIRRLKAGNPKARLMVTGCYAATARAELEALPEVDSVLGILSDGEVVSAAARLVGIKASHTGQARTDGIYPRAATEGHSRAFLKIQDGCDLGCSFCIVPRARGGSRSVPATAVVQAINELTGQGFQEVVLCGPNLGGWGRDQQPRQELADLLDRISRRPPQARVRLSSINPNEFTPRLIELVTGSPWLCPHLHIPIQSGDDRMLELMRRRYDCHQVSRLLESIHRNLPRACIGTDVITGFPGEDDASFARTRDFLTSLPLSHLHVFPFSPRQRTPAARMPGRPRGKIVRQRVSELSAIGMRLRQQHAARFLGREVEVLVESKRDRASGMLRGYTRHYVRVILDGSNALMNRRVRVFTRQLLDTTLVGTVLRHERTCHAAG